MLFTKLYYYNKHVEFKKKIKMKKYIKPVMEVTEVEVGVILAGSGTTPSYTPSNELIDDDKEILARPSNGSLWD